MKLTGWGRYPILDAKVFAPRTVDDIVKLVKLGSAIPRGNGRAYGDSAISASNTIHMRYFNRMLAFDDNTGQLIAEASVLLADIIEIFLPRGWFPAVTPGTKFVTLGGMIAADVHGKNHHKDSSFGRTIDWLEIITNEGNVKRCSSSENAELFKWTIGGMGLTGIILRAAFRLRSVSSAWIIQRTIAAENIDHAIELFEGSLDTTYSVAWIDCLQRGKYLGRSLVVLGEHAEVHELPITLGENPFSSPLKRKLTIPINFPEWALNRFAVRAFNTLYYWNGKRKPREQLVDWDSYFYPLDAVLGWNKIYGRRGFAQFQCVIPLSNAKQGLNELLLTISETGAGSFLAVLKRFGGQESLFSFPMKGYTLALDFPINKKTLNLMKQLDQITLKNNGRFYLAKDSRISRDTFVRSDPRANAYCDFRTANGCKNVFSSAQSERLGL